MTFQSKLPRYLSKKKRYERKCWFSVSLHAALIVGQTNKQTNNLKSNWNFNYLKVDKNRSDFRSYPYNLFSVLEHEQCPLPVELRLWGRSFRTLCSYPTVLKTQQKTDDSTCNGFLSFGQLSHASPTPSPSVSFWSLFFIFGQLSFSMTPKREKKCLGYNTENVDWIIYPFNHLNNLSI